MNLPAFERLVDAHLAAYCEPDAARRSAQLRTHWNPLGRLIDPPMEAMGPAGISDQAATLLAQFPGHRFERSTGLDMHHHFIRYGWRLLDPAGACVLDGVDFMEVDADGRIARVVGFFAAEPPALRA